MLQLCYVRQKTKRAFENVKWMELAQDI